MYNKYKNKYLLTKKMVGGTKLSFNDLKKSIHQILSSQNTDSEKFNQIAQLIELIEYTKNSPFIFYKMNEQDYLIDIILNFDIDLVAGYLEMMFMGFIGYFHNKSIITNFSFFIRKIIDRTKTDAKFERIILARQNKFSYFIQLILFFDSIQRTNQMLTNGVIEKFNHLKSILEDPEFEKAANYLIEKNNEYIKILNSINLFKQISSNMDVEQVITSQTFNLNVQVLSYELILLIDKIHKSLEAKPENISKYYNFLSYVYTNINCKDFEIDINKQIDLVSKYGESKLGFMDNLCSRLKSFITHKIVLNLKTLVSKQFDTLTPDEKSSIYSSYLELEKNYTQGELGAFLGEDLEQIIQVVKECRFYYLSVTFNQHFWEGIFNYEELDQLGSQIEKDTAPGVDIIKLIKQMIPYYFSVEFINQEQHNIIYTTLVLVGRLNTKIHEFFNSKIVIKGGKAIQFRPPHPTIPGEFYKSDDIDLLIISENPFFAKSLAFNLSILVKHLLKNSPSVLIKFPNPIASSPTDNINIVKISNKHNGKVVPPEFIPGKGLSPGLNIEPGIKSIVDIDFSQYDPKESKYNFFANEFLEPLDHIPNMTFYIQMSNVFIEEKIFYFIKYYLEKNSFFTEKFSKPIRYLFGFGQIKSDQRVGEKEFKEFVMSNKFILEILRQQKITIDSLFEGIFQKKSIFNVEKD